jgi:CheY-like chemotaxis protein
MPAVYRNGYAGRGNGIAFALHASELYIVLHEATMTPCATAVLIVEDDVPIQRLLTALMTHNGLSSVVAADGKSALALLEEHDYDAIVLDLLLPEVNGFDVLREIAAAKPALLERTIVVTAAAERAYRNSPQVRNARMLLRKPFDLMRLQQEILDCCASH